MKKHIDYYLSLQSPWTYLGHRRLLALAERHGAAVSVWPIDFGQVFPATGGLPLPKRAPARQAYRMTELNRWSKYLNIPLNPQPKHFPANDKPAALAVVWLRDHSDTDNAVILRFVGNVLTAVWAEERDIGDAATLTAIADGSGLDGATLLAQSGAAAESLQTTIDNDSQTAIARGVFGAPSYVVNDEIFWGQDRLELLAWTLERSS